MGCVVAVVNPCATRCRSWVEVVDAFGGSVGESFGGVLGEVFFSAGVTPTWNKTTVT